MIFVWKDLDRDVGRIDAIPSQSIETIKDWLTSIEIKYYESKVNLNWKNVLKSIKEVCRSPCPCVSCPLAETRYFPCRTPKRSLKLVVGISLTLTRQTQKKRTKKSPTLPLGNWFICLIDVKSLKFFNIDFII